MDYFNDYEEDQTCSYPDDENMSVDPEQSTWPDSDSATSDTAMSYPPDEDLNETDSSDQNACWPDDSQNMSVDPGQSTWPDSDSDSATSDTQQSSSDDMCSYYDYGVTWDTSSSDSSDETNLGNNNSDPVCESGSEENYYSDFSLDSSSGGMSVDPMGSYISDIPIAPNVVLTADGEDLMSLEWPAQYPRDCIRRDG